MNVTTQMPTSSKIQKPASNDRPSALGMMAAKLNVDPSKLLDTLKATVFKNATNEELLALVVVSNTYDLSPLLKEIYAFPAKGGGIVPIVSVDGWNKMLLRQPDFDGIEFQNEHDERGQLISCTATIFVKNRSHPVKITEYFEECKRNTEPWNNMPHRMLRNRTLCQASRVAFGFSGIHDEDEAAAITVETTVEPPKLIPASKPKSQPEQDPLEGTGPAKTVQHELADLVTSNGFTLDHLLKWGSDTGNLPEADSIGSFDDIKDKDATRLLRARVGLLKGLADTKGATV